MILKEKATQEQISEVSKIYNGFTKVVVDIEREILSAGCQYHIDCEEELITNGSKQENLWAGGYTFESKVVDYYGMTNYKSNINHYLNEVSIPEVREKMDKIIRKIFEQ